LQASGLEIEVGFNGALGCSELAADRHHDTLDASAALANDVQAGTHITAVGADGGGKQELDAELFARENLIVVDSRSQRTQFGDSSFALERKLISPQQLIELGDVIQGGRIRRHSHRIIIADLTGVVVQDIAIAESVVKSMSPSR
jgi:ornithine cyclodeaminase